MLKSGDSCHLLAAQHYLRIGIQLAIGSEGSQLLILSYHRQWAPRHVAHKQQPVSPGL